MIRFVLKQRRPQKPGPGVMMACLLILLTGSVMASRAQDSSEDPPAGPGEPDGITGRADPAEGSNPAGLITDSARWRLTDMASDGAGRAWGLLKPGEDSREEPGRRKYPAPAVFDSQAGGWRICDISPLTAGSGAERLIALGDGRMACLRDWGNDWLLTRLSPEGEEERWGEIPRTLYNPSFFPLGNGGLVVTARSPKFFYLSADARTPAALEVPDSLWRNEGRREASEAVSYGELDAIECPDGSVWLWHCSLQKETWARCLNGIVSWVPDSGKFTGFQPFGEGTPVSALVADGPGHLLAAVPERGLRRISLTDFSVETVPVPGTGPGLRPVAGVGAGAGAGAAGREEAPAAEPERPFDYVEKMAWAAGRLYAVTCPKPDVHDVEALGAGGFVVMTRRTFYDASARTGTLWRWDWGQGGFHPLIEGLDAEPLPDGRNRPLTAARGGLLAGAADERPWWLPDRVGGQAFQLNDAGEFYLRSVTQLAVCGDGTMIGRSGEDRWAWRPLPGSCPEGLPVRQGTLRTDSPMIRDSRGWLWALGVGGAEFAAWDSRVWREYPLPEAVRALKPEMMSFCADGKNQGWLIPDDGGKTAVFDFEGARGWQVFGSLKDAVRERLAPGDAVAAPHFRRVLGPVSHANGSKAFFLAGQGKAFVLIDGKWSESGPSDRGEPGEQGALLNGAPYFNPEGAFCLPVQGGERRTSDGRRWDFISSKTREEPAGLWDFQDQKEEEPEGGWGVREVDSATRDRHGVVWLVTHGGGLWKWLDGKTAQVKNQDRPLLVPLSVDVSAVLTDSAGNAFLSSANAGRSLISLIVRPRSVPAAVPAPELVSADPGRAVLKSAAPAGAWQRWRVDGGDWENLTRLPDNRLELPAPGPGPHRVEIAVFDEELTAQGEVQTLAFTVPAMEATELTALIDRLGPVDPDGREAAARALRAQGEAALPALRKALENPAAGESQRWWLRAVMQRIGDRRSRAAGTD